MTLQEFKSSELTSYWIEFHEAEIYLRKSKKFINAKLLDFLEIGNINIAIQNQRKGIFTNFIKTIIEQFPNENFYVENIMNENVTKVLNKFDFQIHNIDTIFKCMYKLKN